MHRFYFDEATRQRDSVLLDEAEARHAVQVLRLKKGARVVLLDGLGGVFEAELTEAGKRVTARILRQLPDGEPRVRVTLYQGLPKSDKLETILQKCTELGVHALQPVLFSRCVKEPGKNAEKSLQRLRRVAREAAKQCGRGQVPMVGQTKPLTELLERIAGHDRVLVPWEEAADTHIADALGSEPPQEIALVIGPEGGITAEEIEQLRGVGARVVTMGPRILRTETAGMAALSAILTLTGDL